MTIAFAGMAFAEVPKIPDSLTTLLGFASRALGI
jgi:hypothetical protein